MQQPATGRTGSGEKRCGRLVCREGRCGSAPPGGRLHAGSTCSVVSALPLDVLKRGSGDANMGACKFMVEIQDFSMATRL